MKNLRHFSGFQLERTSKWLFVLSFMLLININIYGQCLMQDNHNHNHDDIPSLTEEQIAIIKQQLTVTPINNGAENGEPIYGPEICYINVNIHFILDNDGTGNFRKNDDGHGNTNYTGYDRAEDLINSANVMLANNEPVMWFNPPQPIVKPINLQLVLNGVYFHKNSTWSTASYNPSKITQLDTTLGKDIYNTINIFFTRNGATTTNNLNCTDGSTVSAIVPRLQGQANGFANNPAASIVHNDWNYYTFFHYENVDCFPVPTYELFNAARLVLHELGHNWDLHHSWGFDFCNDTKSHQWDWVFQCSTNNLMDYSCHEPAITPCQLDRMNNVIFGILSEYIHQCGYAPTIAFFDLPESIDMGTNPLSASFRGKGSWAETSYKLEIFSVSQIGSTTPTNSSDIYTTLQNGTVGTLNLASFYNFIANKTYLVRLTTYNDCDSDVMIKYIKALPTNTSGPSPGPGPSLGGGKIGNPSNGNMPAIDGQIGENLGSHQSSLDVFLAPNPAKNLVQLSYEALHVEVSNIQLSIVGINGQIVFNNIYKNINQLPLQLSLEGIESGIYSVVLKTSSSTTTKKLIIIK